MALVFLEKRPNGTWPPLLLCKDVGRKHHPGGMLMSHSVYSTLLQQPVRIDTYFPGDCQRILYQMDSFVSISGSIYGANLMGDCLRKVHCICENSGNHNPGVWAKFQRVGSLLEMVNHNFICVDFFLAIDRLLLPNIQWSSCSKKWITITVLKFLL